MRVGSSRVAVACAIALAIGEGGCAMIMQQAPKENRAPGEAPVCSSGRGGVALDVIMTTLLGAGALVALANDEPGVGLGVGAVGGAYAYSAMSGHRSATACEEAREEYELEIAARRPGPPPREMGAAPAAAAATAAAPPPVRPAGPPIEEAAAPEPEGPPVEESVAAPEPAPPAAEPEPAAAAAPRDWSDFWVEVAR